MSNRLAQETSPYLRQHSENPVDWYPWGEEALARARSEDRPILLSIGYSACHWCHVMERESFDDPRTAELMNAEFVNIKVDREERPDLDAIYMRAVQAMTGHGGWPLTAFLTPSGAPYYGGTYFPPEPRSGMPAFRQVLRAASEAWRVRPEETAQTAERVREFIARATIEADGPPPDAAAPASVDPDLLDAAWAGIARRYDTAHGGFGPAPKFPQPTSLEFLLRHHARTGDVKAMEMVTHTLDRMAAGGIHDQLGGGFHRYSVDARWLVPHFEKMLYDNALLARSYLHAHLASGELRHRRIAESTLDYILADLRSPEGGFYTARDADTDGEEGRFYLWTPAEIEAAVGWEEAPLIRRLFGVTPQGNFEGRNVLHLPRDPELLAEAEGLDETEVHERLAHARDRLRRARDRREKPRRDEKVVASLNGLAIRSFAEAGAAFGNPLYLDAARRGMAFVLDALRPGSHLLHVTAEGQAKIPAFLDDYGAVGNALLSLYEATLEPDWLSEAAWCIEMILADFLDTESGIFFDAPVRGEQTLVRSREVADRATPSGNALVAEFFLRAAVLLDRAELRTRIEAVLERERHAILRHPAGFGGLLSAADFLIAPTVEIAVIGPRSHPGTAALLRAAFSGYLPNRVVAGRAPNETLPLRVPLVEGRSWVDQQPTAWVCRDFSCREPVTRPEALLEQLT